MAAAQSFDLVILGSGSTAFAAALRAQELGKTVVMTEERTLGGTCVNRGCLPSKNLIEAAKLLHDARHPRYPGLRAAAMEFDFVALVEQKDDLVHDYRERKYQSLVGGKIRIEKGHVQFVDSHTVEVDGRRLPIARRTSPAICSRATRSKSCASCRARSSSSAADTSPWSLGRCSRASERR